MFDNQSMNDFELSSLERQLSSIDLSPPARQRERLLYACGRAVGRAEMRQRVRAASAAALVLSCTSAVLCWLLVTHGGVRETSTVERLIASTTDRRSPGSPSSIASPERLSQCDGCMGQLTASTRFAQLTVWEGRPIEPGLVGGPSLAPSPVLTAAGVFVRGDSFQ